MSCLWNGEHHFREFCTVRGLASGHLVWKVPFRRQWGIRRMYVSLFFVSITVHIKSVNVLYFHWCLGINYFDLDYGTTLHFATIGSDNGHQGIITAAPFLNQPEVLVDYSYRGAHATAVVGQQLVKAYYNNVPSKSYYLGCSAGGRQGVQFALKYPDFFDGILAGSPAIDWNHFYGWSGMLT